MRLSQLSLLLGTHFDLKCNVKLQQHVARLNEFTEQRGAKVLRHVLVTKALPVPPASLSTAAVVYITLVTFYSSIYLYFFATIEFSTFFVRIKLSANSFYFDEVSM